jgi:hypothetical protein
VVKVEMRVSSATNAGNGLLVVQGIGSLGKLEVETPSLIRYGEMTKDELFVTADAPGFIH